MASHHVHKSCAEVRKHDAETPQVAALREQFKTAAQAPAPTAQSTLCAGPVSENMAPVRAVAWDLFGLNIQQLREVKELGFDAIVMNCLWNDVQPTAEKWNWDKFRRYADDAQYVGLELIFRGPVAAPFWMGESFAFRDYKGKASFHGVSGRVLSFWNREAQSRLDEFLARAWEALELSRFWAIEATIGQGGECLIQSVRFNADGSHDDEVPLWCFDPHALQAFRFAMRARYEDDLNALNRAAGQKWRAWNDVMPAPDVAHAQYFADTLAWYQSELMRFIDGMIHRLLPHRCVILSRAASLDYAPRFWGAGSVEIEHSLWELGARWAKYFVDVRHFYYSLVTYNANLHYYFAHQIARGHPQRAYAGVEYATGAQHNAPKVRALGAHGMICGVNDHLYQFHGGAPSVLITENARQLAQAIEKFKGD